MPTFAYSGRTRGGQNVNGERAADNMDAAVAALRRDQILVTRITPSKDKAEPGEKKKGRLGKAVSPKSLAVFVRQFSVMIDAGLPLVQCLEILGTQEEDKHFAVTILQTRSDVESGASLADAMKKHPEGVRSAFHQHDCRRRGRRYSRHHSQAAGHLHRKGGEAEEPGEVRDDLSGGRHRDRGPRWSA
jgi:type IV pilus assembly protein PilC